MTAYPPEIKKFLAGLRTLVREKGWVFRWMPSPTGKPTSMIRGTKGEHVCFCPINALAEECGVNSGHEAVGRFATYGVALGLHSGQAYMIANLADNGQANYRLQALDPFRRRLFASIARAVGLKP